MFSHSMGCFYFLDDVFEAQDLTLMKPNLSIFNLIACALGIS